jgi:hypothetical protein
MAKGREEMPHPDCLTADRRRPESAAHETCPSLCNAMHSPLPPMVCIAMHKAEPHSKMRQRVTRRPIFYAVTHDILGDVF